jgi:ATP-dependent 26S proteasome regulatory subunit
MTTGADKQISTALRARVPVVGVETHEEDRVLAMLRELSVNPRYPEPRKPDDATRPVIGWSITRGFFGISMNESDIPLPPDVTDPIAGLQWFLDWGVKKPDQPMIFAMFDTNPAFAKAAYTRLIREAALALRIRKQTLFLVAPYFNLPPDLTHDVTVITYPLPSADELTHLVEIKMDAVRELGVPTDVTTDEAMATIGRALAGMTMMRAEEAVRIAIAATGGFVLQDALPILLDQKASMVRASGALRYQHTQAKWSDIGGLDLLKEYALKSMRSFEPAASEFGVTRRRGVLLIGLPGCGKSLFAKAIAGNRLPLITLDVGALFAEMVGQSERQIRQALAIVEAIDRLVLHIDEIDKGLGSSGGERDGNTSQRVFGTLLTWMEETTCHAYVVATANRIELLRPELLRRFDDIFFVPEPDPIARLEILNIHLRKRKQDPARFDLCSLVDATASFTGSEIEQICENAVMEAYCDGARPVTDKDLREQADLKWDCRLAIVMADELAHMREWATRARAASSTQAVGIQPASRAELQVEL